ncbi:MAG: hypothetical protein MUP30_00700 [Deltaproteobacteria bacterium]|nr:hypothetical protein [Deltaproteobacteria bacterium]
MSSKIFYEAPDEFLPEGFNGIFSGLIPLFIASFGDKGRFSSYKTYFPFKNDPDVLYIKNWSDNGGGSF